MRSLERPGKYSLLSIFSLIFSKEPNWKIQTVADFLNIQDFSKYYPITLKHKGAASEPETKSGTVFFSNEAAPKEAC